MNYGQHVTISSGDTSRDAGELDNLNQENWEAALAISKPVDLPEAPELRGENLDLNSAEFGGGTEHANVERMEMQNPREFDNLETPTKEATIKSIDEALELGRIAQIKGVEKPKGSKGNFNFSNIRTSGDKLEKTSIFEIDTAMNELNQTGNLSDFYEDIRNMTEVNLSNSFNRKLYDAGLNEGER